VALPLTVMILWLHCRITTVPPAEWLLIGITGVTGLLVDSTLASSGLLGVEAVILGIPLWLLCLWLLFATTLRHSLAWLSQRPILSIVLGAIAGPTSYYSGSFLADVSLATPHSFSLLVIAALWAVLLPLLFIINRRLDDVCTTATD